MVKIISKQNNNLSVKNNSRYSFPIFLTGFQQKISFQKALTQDIFEKQTPTPDIKEHKYTHSVSKPDINFTGKVDDEKSKTISPIDPIEIASPEEREKVKRAFIQALEQGNFIDGNLCDIYKNGLLTKQDILEIATSQAGRIPKQDLGFLIKNKIPLTPFDNEDVLNARLYNLETRELDSKSSSYRQQRSKIIKNEIKKMENIPAQRKMVIITGLPAAGKSTLVNKELKDYYIADTDEYKKQFKEYADGKGASIVHNASRNILEKSILPEAMNRGINMVVSTIGWADYIEKLVKTGINNGYTVELIHINITPEKSIQRSLKRFRESKRLIDPYTINQIKNVFPVKIEKLPEHFEKCNFIRTIHVYDNNGECLNLFKIVK